MLEFKRGIVISAIYEIDNSGYPLQKITVKDTDGKEYEVSWTCFGVSYNDFFGEGDKVSFLYDDLYHQVIRIKLNPFYKE